MSTESEPVVFYWPQRATPPIQLSTVRELAPIAGYFVGINDRGVTPIARG